MDEYTLPSFRSSVYEPNEVRDAREGRVGEIADIILETDIKVIDDNDKVVEIIPGYKMRFS